MREEPNNRSKKQGTIYFAKIPFLKLLQPLENVDFVGESHDP